MFNSVIIQTVPFCYGPTSISLAIARSIKKRSQKHIVAFAGVPSLDLLEVEDQTFSSIHKIDPSSTPILHCAQILEADLIISICDFDFAKQLKSTYPEKKLVFIDPLLWMWDCIPDIINMCDMYYVLDFPGVPEIVKKISSKKIKVIPQIAEFFGASWQNHKPTQIITVNLGGMQSPLGANADLALAMCQEIIKASEKSPNINRVLIRTSSIIADKLHKAIPKNSMVSIGNTKLEKFQEEIRNSDLLLTAPGMSIVFESVLGKIPTFFLLPLNYSQHLQIKKYANMFKSLPAIRWTDFSSYEELPTGLNEQKGVQLANELGIRFYNDRYARNIFQCKLSEVFDNHISHIPPLSPMFPLDISGAEAISYDLQKKGFI